ncbi:tryptophan 2,3-dioxygenase [Hyalella azteca]|uniref:Tryptophan 2,3-dioxygenase n=1 Tax=Hyalella azteca TaxID=294128 RepID=A0A8B7PKG0_HYAAZ|nr:tryptophan 2,3-dioxygenase [Hyalella azteca]
MACPFMAAQQPDNNCDNDLQGNQEMHYRTYLGLDNLLSLNKPVTEKLGNLCHDEHLFITVHQVFELWFKQILKELGSVMELLKDHLSLPLAVRRLERATQILEHTTTQFPLLESMTPLDFKEFRDHLAPASGFQSHQFRYIENIVGVRPKDRIPFNRTDYRFYLRGNDDILEKLDSTESEPTLLLAVNSWLEEIYDRDNSGERFWLTYQQALKNFIDNKPGEAQKAAAAGQFESLLQETAYAECLERGERRLSYKAFKGALLVTMLCDEADYCEPYRFVKLLVKFDITLTKWRFQHLMMVQQQIGPTAKGLGGGAVVPYLKATLSDSYKAFLDLSRVTSLLLPRSLLKEAATLVQEQSVLEVVEGSREITAEDHNN